jgi:hypothetical protein
LSKIIFQIANKLQLLTLDGLTASIHEIFKATEGRPDPLRRTVPQAMSVELKAAPMPMKRPEPTRIIDSPRRMDMGMTRGASLPETTRSVRFSETTHRGRRRHFRRLKLARTKQMSGPERENSRLRKGAQDLNLAELVFETTPRRG